MSVTHIGESLQAAWLITSAWFESTVDDTTAVECKQTGYKGPTVETERQHVNKKKIERKETNTGEFIYVYLSFHYYNYIFFGNIVNTKLLKYT